MIPEMRKEFRLMAKFMAALGLSLAFAIPAVADEPVALVYRYSPGQVLRYEGKRTMTVESTVSGTTQKFSSETESLREWRVISVDRKGNARMSMSIVRVKVNATEPNGKTLKFDTNTDDGTGPLSAIIGKPLLEVTLSPSGQVVDLSQSQAESAGSFVANVRTMLFQIPPSPVAVGTGWQVDLELPMPPPLGPAEKMRLRQTFRLEKVTDSVAQINLATSTAEEITDRSRLGSIAQYLPSGRIELDLSRGVIRSVEQTIDQTVKDFAGTGSEMRVTGNYREVLKDDVAGGGPNRK
jgi:hypothetical protein